MRISFAATNPCHVYPVALELAKLRALGAYYSGYPRWKLPHSDELPLRTHSFRTNAVYGLLKLPSRWRPNQRTLFRWQDDGFDRWAGRNLEPCDFIHGIPGQCLHTFRAARRLGIRTVLNHATGPVREWVRIMEPEYARIGMRVIDAAPYDADYFRREDEEYALADFHCAASTVVREQLVALGIGPERIWLAPYGADPAIFSPGKTRADSAGFRIVFAGWLGVRKGLRTLLDALTIVKQPSWRVDFYGAVLDEAQPDLSTYHGATPLHFHGSVSQTALAEGFRAGDVLVLPSLEEGFGLVVPQALNCGCPAIVSDRVGGKDLIQPRENGSIVPAADAVALAEELRWWSMNRRRPTAVWDWEKPARTLLAQSEAALRAAT